MDEKERLSGVDAEIQNHAEQDNGQSVPVPDFPELALFLAKSYGQMLKDQERLKAVIDAGVPIYTKEMALRDLASVSIAYESERVQTSNISNKPASIALNYHERMDQINQEWYEHLEKQYLMLDEEIRFFEAALSALSGYLPEFMADMVVNGCTWDYLCEHYHISRTMVAKNRRKAIRELEELYAQRDAEMVSYMLS